MTTATKAQTKSEKAAAAAQSVIDTEDMQIAHLAHVNVGKKQGPRKEAAYALYAGAEEERIEALDFLFALADTGRDANRIAMIADAIAAEVVTHEIPVVGPAGKSVVEQRDADKALLGNCRQYGFYATVSEFVVSQVEPDDSGVDLDAMAKAIEAYLNDQFAKLPVRKAKGEAAAIKKVKNLILNGSEDGDGPMRLFYLNCDNYSLKTGVIDTYSGLVLSDTTVGVADMLSSVKSYNCDDDNAYLLLLADKGIDMTIDADGDFAPATIADAVEVDVE